jgi:hypothetical protein
MSSGVEVTGSVSPTFAYRPTSRKKVAVHRYSYGGIAVSDLA